MFGPKSRFLVVDDSTAMRELTRKSLTNLGFRDIREAANGRDGYQMLLDARSVGEGFDLILCDWLMPHLDGLALLNLIRMSSHFANVPFIMVTTQSEKAKVIEAVQARANGYLIKPFDDEILKQRLTQVHAGLKKKPVQA